MANPPHSPPEFEDLDPVGACDVTLVDAMLSLTPEERLRLNDRMVQCIHVLRHGFAAVRPDDAARTAGDERD
jgi:nitrous oxidase accessory protein NosD